MRGGRGLRLSRGDYPRRRVDPHRHNPHRKHVTAFLWSSQKGGSYVPTVWSRPWPREEHCYELGDYGPLLELLQVSRSLLEALQPRWLIVPCQRPDPATASTPLNAVPGVGLRSVVAAIPEMVGSAGTGSAAWAKPLRVWELRPGSIWWEQLGLILERRVPIRQR